MTAKQIIEALVFASPKPLTTKEIGLALRSAGAASEDAETQAIGKLKEAEIVAVLETLRAEYETQQRAFQLIEKASGWQIVSHPDYGLWVRQLYPESKPARLSGPALETLAIVAYRQPITKADIEAVRGVSVDGMVQMLLERSLVRIAGRAELPGRPLLYETTQYFMEHFGLRNLEELPNSDELRRIELPKAPVANSEKTSRKSSNEADSQPALALESTNESSPLATQTEPTDEAEPAVSEPRETSGEDDPVFVDAPQDEPKTQSSPTEF